MSITVAHSATSHTDATCLCCQWESCRITYLHNPVNSITGQGWSFLYKLLSVFSCGPAPLLAVCLSARYCASSCSSHTGQECCCHWLYMLHHRTHYTCVETLPQESIGTRHTLVIRSYGHSFAYRAPHATDQHINTQVHQAQYTQQ